MHHNVFLSSDKYERIVIFISLDFFHRNRCGELEAFFRERSLGMGCQIPAEIVDREMYQLLMKVNRYLQEGAFEIARCVLLEFLYLLNHIGAVSYTHLDVYKRQLHAYGFLAYVLLYPGLQLFLIIDKNPPVFHGRVIRPEEILRQTDFLLFLHRYIRPEIPGGNADFFTEFIDAVNRSPSVAARNDQPSFPDTEQIRFLYQYAFFIPQEVSGNSVNVLAHSDCSDTDFGIIFRRIQRCV